MILERFGADGTTNVVLQGNYIGTNSAGSAALPNASHGIHVGGVSGNTVLGNLVSGNLQIGISIVDGSANTTVDRNYIGTDASGVTAIPNHGIGVAIQTANNLIQGNLISGNRELGLIIRGQAATGNVVAGNLIGTNAAGTAKLGDQPAGINIFDASDNTIGSSIPTARNVISGNLLINVVIMQNAGGNRVLGNYIGTNATGTAAIDDQGPGLLISNGAHDTIVGGTSPGERNLISGAGHGPNNDEGVGLQIRDSDTSHNPSARQLCRDGCVGFVGHSKPRRRRLFMTRALTI